MLQDAAKRLAYTAKQVKLVESAQGVGGNFDYHWLTEVVLACLFATGHTEMGVELEEVLETRHPPPPVAWLVDFMRPVGHTPFDPLIPWAFQHLRRVGQRNEGEALHMAHDFRESSNILLAWYLATKPDLTKIDLAEAIDTAEEWEATQAAKVVYEFPDGWTMRRLTTRRELEVEGDRMDHCVGGKTYCLDVRRGASIIYSLRDPDDVPHATLEWLVTAKHFKQIFGPEDEPITDAVRPYVVEFITRVHGGALADLVMAGLGARELLRPGVSLPGLYLVGEDLSGLDMTGVNLTQADLSEANLTDATLIDAILIHAYLIDAKLIDAKLIGAKLIGAKLIDAKLIGADLTRADLRDAILSGAKLIGARLIEADLTGTILAGADLHFADLTGAVRADLGGAIFDETTIMPDGSRGM
jgi:hypothetical protein